MRTHAQLYLPSPLKSPARSPRILMLAACIAALLGAFTPTLVPVALAVPKTVNYQGVLNDANGPVEGAVTIIFGLYDAPIAGNLLWQESHTGVTVSKGVFQVLLGSVNPTGNPLDETVLDGANGWLEVSVNGETLTPRRRLSSSAYAIRAGVADTAANIDPPASLIATSDTGSILTAFNNSQSPNPNGGIGVFGANSSAIGAGVKGTTFHETGVAVLGEYTSTLGTAIGVKGRTLSPAGIGVQGLAETGSGLSRGVSGRSESPDGFGVYGSTGATTGAPTAVYGVTAAPGGYAVQGRNSGPGGKAIMGLSTGATGMGVGVYGQSDSPDGVGVLGYVSDPAGTTNAGVYGEHILTTGYAGYFAGKLYVTGDIVAVGSITGASKAFSQPHPTQPGKEIVYIATESPEALVVLRGNARLKDGQAEVRLPEHYQAVAAPGSVQVQLTPYSADTLGLAAVERGTERIVVRELKGGKGSFEFAYTITATRVGYERHQPVRAAAPAPNIQRPTGMAGMTPLPLEKPRGGIEPANSKDSTPGRTRK